MKTRILFVDDDLMALRGVERLLRSMRNEWEMEFVDSGPKALERMAAAPFDAIVTDMRMPGMNGAQLLNEVMKRHPKTVRLVLSGYADSELILKCIGSTHQYLAKPCDADALRTTILRATSLEHSLENETLRQLVARCVSLPSVPALYSALVEALQDPDTHLEKIGDIVARDAAMMAKILKLVNSAFFGLRRQISNPQEAVAYLGVDTIKSLALAAHAFSQYESSQQGPLSIAALWSHSLEVANAAKAVANSEGAERKLVDEAYVAGLLHDVGKLVLATNLAEQYAQVLNLARNEKVTLTTAERQVFGADHADMGGYLLGLWGLPVPVVEAIAYHHQPDRALTTSFTPLTATHVGNVLASAQWPAVDGLPASDLDMMYLAKIGLEDHVKAWRQAWSDRATASRAHEF
ncbi:MAG: response regulator [Verrucomicrobiales bacterium]|nr:response regulator [Verrucomicrobiales bacterium]